MPQKIQVDYSLFLDAYKLVLALDDYELDNNTKTIKKRLQEQINAKITAMEKRDLYTQSKVGDKAEEKEAARQAYLNLAGINDDYRWKEGNSPYDPKNLK